ncbi:MAG: type IV pilus biogenesis/stability protein PilW [Gammaproteobacteria bacterium]|nr:type IV pilus biogenesis/stability protein PilW [Gammaproteobacteria bacterium]MDE2350062.1 type IV pilus biogenesis/stability protein PilW [Gammaproteobacteria bacterium]
MRYRSLGIAASIAASLALAACVPSENLAPGKTPAEAATVNVQLAVAYMQLGKLAISRHFIERALNQDPRDASVQATAGVVFERLGEKDKAENAYDEAARLGRKDPDVMNTYAGYLCRTGRAAQGEKVFRSVIDNPVYQTPEVAMVNAGVCLEGAGDDAGAQRYFDKALVVHPNLPEAMLESGALALRLKDPAKAADIVARYLDVNKPTAEILWLGLRAERALGKADAAADYGQRLEKDFPTSKEARLMQAGITQ